MYRVIGVDGNQYGPVSAEQLATWLAEGRVNAETRTVAGDSTEWKPLGSFPEFILWFSRPGAAPGHASPPLPAPGLKTNGFAIASLAMGILSISLGFCCCYGFPFSLLGIIFGLVALSQINQNSRLYEGRSIAIAGLVLSVISLVLGSVLAGTLGLGRVIRQMRGNIYRL